MKYIKLLKFDLVHGILKQYYKYILFFLLMALAFWECNIVLEAQEIKGETYADYLLYIYGGAKEYIPSPGEIFRIPYLWFLNHILILYFTLNYMYRDLTGIGRQVICRSGSRGAWWFSKCFCQIVSVLIYYLAAWGEILLLSVLAGAEMSWHVSGFMRDIMDFGPNMMAEGNLDVILPDITITPMLFTLSLSLLQMALCLYLRPIFSYIISVAICLASAYAIHFLLIGNYAMALRSNQVISDGVSRGSGIVIMLLIAFFSVFAGKIRFQRYNILDKE